MRAFLKLMCLLVSLTVARGALAQEAELGLYNRHIIELDSSNRHSMQWLVKGYTYTSENFGIWGFGYGERGYASATLGIFFDPVPWLSLGVAAGAEKLSVNRYALGRYAGDIYIGSDESCHIELYYENGVSREYWYEGDAVCRVGRYITFGLRTERFVGIGPQLAVRVGRTPLELYAAGLYEEGLARPNLVVGIQMIFQKRSE